MRKLLLATAALVAFAFVAQAQQVESFTLATNRLYAAATNSTQSSAIFVGSADQVFIGLTFTGASNVVAQHYGNDGVITARLKGSMDGLTYFDHPLSDTNYTISAPTFGLTAVGVVNVIDTSPFQYLKVVSQENTCTNISANLFTVTVWRKR